MTLEFYQNANRKLLIHIPFVITILTISFGQVIWKLRKFYRVVVSRKIDWNLTFLLPFLEKRYVLRQWICLVPKWHCDLCLQKQIEWFFLLTQQKMFKILNPFKRKYVYEKRKRWTSWKVSRINFKLKFFSYSFCFFIYVSF